MGKIIWLASYPKSGNTWMRAFLHNLLRNPNDAYDINKMTDFSTSDSTILWYQKLDKRPWRDWTYEDVGGMRWDVQRLITQTSPDNVFAKTHNAMVEFRGKPLIHMEWTAGGIYIVRNPLDVCISLSHHYGCDIDEAIRILNDPTNGTVGNDIIVYEVHKSWSIHVHSWTQAASPGLLVLRYEDMLHKPLAAFSKVSQFLGLNAPRQRLERAVELSSFDSLRKQEEKRGFRERSNKTDKFFRVGKAGQWREVLTQAQIDRVVEANKEQMQRFGYWPF